MKQGKRLLKKALCFTLMAALLCTGGQIKAVNTHAASKITGVKVTNLSGKSLTMKKGKTKKLKVKVTGKGKNVSQKVTFKSSKSKIVSVSKKGKLKAKKNGKAKITIRSKANKKKKVVIKVTVGKTKKKAPIKKKLPTIKFKSLKVLSEAKVQFELSSAVTFGASNVYVYTKGQGNGPYNIRHRVASVQTKDKKTYQASIDPRQVITKNDYVYVKIQYPDGRVTTGTTTYTGKPTLNSTSYRLFIKKGEEQVDVNRNPGGKRTITITKKLVVYRQL